ncbi:hypothetical protein B0T26DRAFT_745096 [Lasiosphaeria miniovina]|uniref:Nephrocystin 3-like N-terminal domain-containing protein n=1 Tax=Lasiosphaeria miniovina TaxID=1954250 RepID=A0AA40BEZ7_9PEZI|nr:uncharacterized protein B0T26DRAFT_745096 [Lasiosphaeria miniovina]KAK0733002.1 hypothetical protein B0T26DRAFT_745096 [Lasiosphaeria miniovina]
MDPIEFTIERPSLNTRPVDFGPSVVYQPSQPEPVLDIAFIHGLQGHPFRTWAAEAPKIHRGTTAPPGRSGDGETSTIASGSGNATTRARSRFVTRVLNRARKDTASSRKKEPDVFWPRDLLPLQCPEARVLMLGYDTAVAKHQFAEPANKNSVFTHGKNIVNDLSRSRPGVRRRPVLFVAHSLGGIVLKEMLAICSTSNDPGFQDILESTVGVVFLGTPHRGSSAAGIGEIARKATSLLLMDTNPLILDSLSLKNSDLDRCQETFSSLWHKHGFSVKTFQEGLALKLPIRLGQSKMTKVIPDISSCLGDSRERAETLDADHRCMCRFGSALDANYRKVSAELQAVYTRVLDRDDEKATTENVPDENTMTRNFREMLVRHHMISTPAQDTCEWLPTTTAFREWTERNNIDKHFRLLQVTEKPGTGKSTLMKRMFKSLGLSHRTYSAGECVVARFFFNGKGIELERTAVGLFRALLYQIGTAHPACLDWLKTYSKVDLETLEAVNPAAYLHKLEAVVEASAVGYFFGNITRSAYAAGLNLSVCISRREYPPITLKNCLHIPMKRFNSQDIRQYIEHKLSTVNIHSDDVGILRERIAQRLNGIFLWVVLAVDGVLKDVENGKNAKHILKRIKALPKALENLFTTLIKEMDPEDRSTTLHLFMCPFWQEAAFGSESGTTFSPSSATARRRHL